MSVKIKTKTVAIKQPEHHHEHVHEHAHDHKGKNVETKQRTMSLSVDWDKLFGKEVNESKAIHHGFDVIDKDLIEFITKSSYKGGWNLIGMAKFGTYILPHQVEYEGQFNDGMFDGEGMLAYPQGHKVESVYNKDLMEDFKFIFPDGLLYEEPWEYCLPPDRRFYISIQEGLRCSGQEFLTNNEVARTIPPGCFDTGDGFYNPKTKCVQSAIDPSKVLRIPSLSEERWIVLNCRKAWDEPIGYRPDLYEKWCSGRIEERYLTPSVNESMLSSQSK